MKKFLAVGINKFMLPGNDLAGCVPDEQAMDKIGRGLGAETNLTLINEEATKSRNMNNLIQLVNEAKLHDFNYLGFSWSGHGTHYSRPEEPDGLGEALVCYDIREKDGDWDPDTIIKDTELRDLLNQVPPTCIVEVWLDTCYSGGMDRVFGRKNRFLHNPDNPDGLLRVANSSMNWGLNPNVIMWCACSEAQESADAYIAGGSHGAFTWYWIKAFKANPTASRIELLLKTRAGLRAGGYNQFPRLKCWNDAAQAKVGE